MHKSIINSGPLKVLVVVVLVVLVAVMGMVTVMVKVMVVKDKAVALGRIAMNIGQPV